MTSKRIVLLGSLGIGETSFIRPFIDDTFSEDYKVTIGVRALKKAVKAEDNLVNLIIWDTEGTDHVEKKRKAYLLGSEVFIYGTDVTKPKTRAKVIEHRGCLKTHFDNVPSITIGNKNDLYPKGSIAKNKIDIFLSAKKGNNVKRQFERMAKMHLS